MRKNLLTIGVIAAISILGIIIACNKESNLNESNDNRPAMKGDPYDTSNLETLLEIVWNKCDSAYHADSSQFLARCSNNDMAKFLLMTHISPIVINGIAYEANMMYQDFFISNPSITFDTTACLSCITDALPGLGLAMVDHYNIINQIKTYDPTFVDTNLCTENPRVNSCNYKCLPALASDLGRYMCCLLNCELQKHIEENTSALEKLTGGYYDPNE